MGKKSKKKGPGKKTCASKKGGNADNNRFGKAHPVFFDFCTMLATEKNNAKAKVLLNSFCEAIEPPMMPRELCDLYMRFVSRMNGWHPGRVTIFTLYFNSVYSELEKYQSGGSKPVEEEDKRFLLEIASADSEPALLVTNALYLMGHIEYTIEANVGEACSFMSTVISACDAATKEERSRKIPFLLHPNWKTVNDCLEWMRHSAEAYLMAMRQPAENSLSDPQPAVEEDAIVSVADTTTGEKPTAKEDSFVEVAGVGVEDAIDAVTDTTTGVAQDLVDFATGLTNQENLKAVRLFAILRSVAERDVSSVSCRELQDVSMELVTFLDADKWHSTRVFFFFHYCNNMRLATDENYKLATEEDKRFLRGIVRSADSEPAFFVAHALYLLGAIEVEQERNVDGMCHYTNHAIMTCDAAKDEEKLRTLTILPPTAAFQEPRYNETVADHLVALRALSVSLLQRARSDDMKQKLVQLYSLDQKVASAAIVPGDQCDGCGGTEAKPMRVCERCLRTYYCSRHCQKMHWIEHQKLCRQQGEFRVGDLAITRQPFGSSRFGGVCHIVSPVPNCEGEWVVSDTTTENTCILSADKLRVHSYFVRGLTEENALEELD
ncbi:expressed unknown protein [Seminavis robusta]|uniref:MYND-type domain-containing protein n=1 Tax=Seminavis robusta TaxID=568900 RepID=A0A9N8DZ45_9STRA|nr:expressed unknown protein [Seminavis robusta]|eukprot:Sro461_g147860.1 n/a (606) ;mRNA; r:58376-60193